jgi:hypothetical protein
MKIMRTKW